MLPLSLERAQVGNFYDNWKCLRLAVESNRAKPSRCFEVMTMTSADNGLASASVCSGLLCLRYRGGATVIEFAYGLPFPQSA
jgi:hypothetical protein